MNLPMPIITPRLIIQPPRLQDAVIVNQAIHDAFEELHKFMDWADKKPTLQETEDTFIKPAINSWQQELATNLPLLIWHKDDGRFIGATGFHNIVWNVPKVDTGYWLAHDAYGQGFMTEACRALTYYAFDVMHVKRIGITCDVDNERSKKIPERLGFICEGIQQRFARCTKHGTITDVLMYARYNTHGLADSTLSSGSSDKVRPGVGS